jgi:hypothetical protein
MLLLNVSVPIKLMSLVFTGAGLSWPSSPVPGILMKIAITAEHEESDGARGVQALL